jgi:predicted O-linked N-acetylglucosamine transferase (SPINDLY family)
VNLAAADREQLANNFAEAVRLYRLSLAEDPGRFDAWYGLACALDAQQEHADAIVAYRRALALRPEDPGLHLNLGSALFALGHSSDAVRNFRIAAASRAAEVRAMALRNLACIAPGDPELDDAAVLELRQAWHSEQARHIAPVARQRNLPGRRLRIAYYGAFFAARNWMKMYMGVLNAHDRARFEVHLIVDGALPSEASGYRDHDDDRIWQVAGVANAELAGHLAAAQIDVLIDLNGYSHAARLPLLLHRPAPVQIAWNGMYATTGLDCVDALVADPVALPPGEERHYSERIHRVRGTYLAFEVFYATPDVAPPPVLQNGHVTFGSLVSAYKLTGQTLDAWSRILHSMPTARLLVRNAALDRDCNRRELLARFAEREIPAQRLCLLGSAEHTEFLRTYDQIDIALDAFPYNGGTTTVEALWQGVPVLTTNGDRWAGRTSRSLLTAAGLGEWVAPDLPGLVDRAVRLARTDLAAQRAAQRAKIAASAACDVVGLCRELEDLYVSEHERRR